MALLNRMPRSIVRRIRGQRPRTVLVVAICLAWAASIAGASGPVSASEDKVKAAFLFNFAKLVQWPDEQASEPLVFAVVGDPTLAEALETTVRGRTVRGRSLRVLRLEAMPGADQPVHVLLVAPAAYEALASRSATTLSRALLVVADTRAGLASGATMAFSIADDRVRFVIDPDRAHRAGLRVSSKLLELAEIVRTPAGEGAGGAS